MKALVYIKKEYIGFEICFFLCLSLEAALVLKPLKRTIKFLVLATKRNCLYESPSLKREKDIIYREVILQKLVIV